MHTRSRHGSSDPYRICRTVSSRPTVPGSSLPVMRTTQPTRGRSTRSGMLTRYSRRAASSCPVASCVLPDRFSSCTRQGMPSYSMRGSPGPSSGLSLSGAPGEYRAHVLFIEPSRTGACLAPQPRGTTRLLASTNRTHPHRVRWPGGMRPHS